MSGQRAKKSDGLAAAHNPAPPAQFCMPDWIRDTPINMTVGPVTKGGKMRSMILVGMKEMRISSSAHTAEVPIMAPYPSGQGRGVPSGAEGQKPFSYI